MLRKSHIRVMTALVLICFMFTAAPLADMLFWGAAALTASAAETIPEPFSLGRSGLSESRSSGLWDYAVREDDLYAIITGYRGNETEVSVPAMLDGTDVVGIESRALSGMETVYLHGNILYIAEDAFGESKPKIVAPNGTYGLWWAYAHYLDYSTGRDYDLVPGVIDYSDALKGRVQKRGEDYVLFGKVEALRLSEGSMVWLRDNRGMEFFYRVLSLVPQGSGVLAEVRIPDDLAEAIINYETTVEIALTADDFIPAQGVVVETGPSRAKSIATDTQTETFNVSGHYSGKTKPFGNNKSSSFGWDADVTVGVADTVIYTIIIHDGDVKATEMVKKQTYSITTSVSCKASEDLIKQYGKSKKALAKAANGEALTAEEEEQVKHTGSLIGKPDYDSVGFNNEDIEKTKDYFELLDKYSEQALAASHIEHEAKLGSFILQSPYFNFTLSVSCNLSVEGSVTYSETTTNITKQHWIPKKGGARGEGDWVVDYSNGNTTSNEKEKSLTIEVKGSLGLRVGIAIGAFFFSNLSAEMELGVIVSLEKKFDLSGYGPALGCSVLTVEPYLSLNVYTGLWLGKSTGIKASIYNKRWTAADLLGKEYLLQAHINLAVSPAFHLPENCPFETEKTIHYETGTSTLIQDRKALIGDYLDEDFNVTLENDSTAGLFRGWAWSPQDTTPTAALAGGSFINPDGSGDPIVIETNITLYAVWERSYVVHFDSNGGSPVPDQVVPANGYIIQPANPEKRGSVLLSWKDDSGTDWLFDQYQVIADMTLIAEWDDTTAASSGGTKLPFYIGEKSEVSPECIINPKTGGDSGAYYLNYYEINLGNDGKGIVISGVRNDPVNLVIPAYLPSPTAGQESMLKVVDIRNEAFWNCTSLRSVYFRLASDSQIDIHYYNGFNGCTNLEYVELPRLENGEILSGFEGCINLKCVKMPAGTKCIGGFSETAISSLKPIQGVSELWNFSNCTSLKEIDLSGSDIESIGNDVFNGCTALTSVIFGPKIRYIDGFQGCSALESIYIPESVEYVSMDSFKDCTSIKEINIRGPERIRTRSYKTGSRVLQKITIGGKVKRIGDTAFGSGEAYDSDSYYSNGYDFIPDHPIELIIEEGVEEIEDNAFMSCSAFTSVSLPGTIRIIGGHAFAGCTSIKSVNLYGVEELGPEAFKDCTALSSVNIGNKLKKIWWLVFQNCVNLGSITLPASLQDIDMWGDAGPMAGCSGMKEMTVGGPSVLPSGYLTTKSPELSKVTIRGSVNTIGTHSFSSMAGYGSAEGAALHVKVEEGVRTIASNSFDHNLRLRSITIPSSVSSIGDYAFDQCSNLTDVYFDCKSGEDISISDNSFSGNAAEMTFHLSKENSSIISFCEAHEIAYDIDGQSPFVLTVIRDDMTKTYNVTGGRPIPYIQMIEDFAVSGQGISGWYTDSELTDEWYWDEMPMGNLTLYPKYIRASSNGQFRTEEDHAVLVQYRMVEGEADKVYLPGWIDGLPLTAIEKGAFADCEVREIYLPETIVQLSADAFIGCTMLEKVNVSDGNENYKSVEGIVYTRNGDTLVYYPALAGNSLIMADGVTAIAENAFASSNIANITFSESLLSIGSHAFEKTLLTDAALPAGIQEIGEYAFSSCKSINFVETNGNPETVSDTAFDSCNPFMLVYGPDEDCALRRAARAMGFLYNAHSLSLIYPDGVRTSFLQSGYVLTLPQNPDVGENTEFLGWFTDETCSIPFTGKTMPNCELTLWAGTTTILTYETFDVDGVICLRITGCAASSADIAIPANINDQPVKAIASGSFGEQYDTVIVPASVTEIDEDAFAAGTVLICDAGSYSALWAVSHQQETRETEYELAFNTGCELEHASSRLSAGEQMDLPTLQRSGYSLAGWFWDEAREDEVADGAEMPDHSVTLYAGWNVADETLAELLADMRWSVSEDKVTITEYTGIAASISIPSEINGLPVTTIGNEAFAFCTMLREVTIPSSVTQLGSRVFLGDRNLQTVNLPSSLTEIPVSAFDGCFALKQITLPEGIRIIEEKAFENTGLTSVTLPATLTTIRGSSLRNCLDLAEILVASGNTYYESRNGVLYDISDGSITRYPPAHPGNTYFVDNEIWSIGAWAFQGSNNLEGIFFGDDVYSIGEGAFANSLLLSEVSSFGSMVTRIPDECFYGCPMMKSISIPNTVKKIGARAFVNTGITELEIPDSIITIGNNMTDVFVTICCDSGSAAEIWARANHVPVKIRSQTAIESMVFAEERVELSVGRRLPTDLMASPANAVTNGINYYSTNTSVVQVDSSGTLYGIGAGIANVYATAPGGITAFCMVTVNRRIEFTMLEMRPQQVTMLLGDSLRTEVAFLPEEASADDLIWTSSDENVAYVGGDGRIYAIGTGTVTITVSSENGISDQCVVIVENGGEAFILPASLLSLDEQALAGSSVKYVVVPDGCEFIGSKAFADCDNLTVVLMPSSVTSIAENAFRNCEELIIVAPQGSYAQQFAAAHSIPFAVR